LRVASNVEKNNVVFLRMGERDSAMKWLYIEQ